MSTWVDSTAAYYVVDLPLGCYFITVMATIQDPGEGTTGAISLAPYLNAARTEVGAVFHMRALDAAISVATMSLVAGDTIAGYASDANANTASGVRSPILVPFGLRLRWNKADTSPSTIISVKLIAARDA
jgi:hypothetical protein